MTIDWKQFLKKKYNHYNSPYLGSILISKKELVKFCQEIEKEVLKNIQNNNKSK